MHRPRHRPRRSARLSFSLLSVLALVAFACLPALAQAECTDSSCAQYEVEIPTAEGKNKKNGKSESGEPSAEASNKGGGNNGSQSGEDGSEENEEGKGGAAPGKDNGGGNPGDKGSGGNPSNGKEGLEGSHAVEGPTQQGQAASASDDGGGSSPLVPILIAVAVLAAISIGAVIYRQRRQGGDGSGSPVSPKAG